MNIEKDRKKIIVIYILAVLTVMGLMTFLLKTDIANADTYSYKIKVKNGPLNVRAKASTNSKTVALAKKGLITFANGKGVDKNNVSWYRIRIGRKTGYICSKYVKLYYGTVTYSSYKAGITKEVLNVRSGADAKKTKVGCLNKNAKINIRGEFIDTKGTLWYRLVYKKKYAYVVGKYVKLGKNFAKTGKKARRTKANYKARPKTKPKAKNKKVKSRKGFEKYIASRGFPDSYKPYLRKLHKKHPKWIFVAQKTGIDWNYYQKRARRIGVNLVDVDEPKRWRSKSPRVYKAVYKKKKLRWEEWTRFDGRWYQAKNSVIAYYTDPRNFINEDSIYQFMGHKFDDSSQTQGTIKAFVSVSRCFLNTKGYIKTIYKASKSAGVNPNVIAAMIIMEQGWSGGSGLISGTYSGYEGYYNFLNIGAYHADGMNSIQRGLWWAMGTSSKRRTFGRPWNSRYKAIKGGALFYAKNYINARQDTYYTKKFNVMNGARNLAEHEYMTNVSGADAEGKLLKYAYRSNNNFPIKFYIPVFNNMPQTPCVYP